MEAKYLKITIHDNDFMSYAGYLADAIQGMFHFYNWIPKNDEDLEKLKPAIAHIWYGMAMIGWVARTQQETQDFYKYLIKYLELSIVEFHEVTEEGTDYEYLFIPLDSSNEYIIV